MRIKYLRVRAACGLAVMFWHFCGQSLHLAWVVERAGTVCFATSASAADSNAVVAMEKARVQFFLLSYVKSPLTELSLYLFRFSRLTFGSIEFSCATTRQFCNPL